MIRHIAPVATPINLFDLINGIKGALTRDTLEIFKQEVNTRYNIKHSFFTSTGRAALTVVLMSLHELAKDSKRNEVIISAYTCYSVAASVLNAGLKIRVCDIDSNTLSYNLEKLEHFDHSKILAIVTANLYGIPNELDKILSIAKTKGIYLVDDAAQCLDGKINDKYSGTFGDAGIFSLDKGKNITSMEGGIIATDSDDLAKILQKKINQAPRTPSLTIFKNLIKFIIYLILINPRLYWIPNKMPFLGLGKTAYDTNFEIEQYSNTLAGIGLSLFRKIDSITRIRLNNASYLIDKLSSIPGITLPLPRSYIKPVFLRLPILVSMDIRDHLIKRLNDEGIGASYSYPGSIVDIEEIKSELNINDLNANEGRMVAKQIITLPTHHYVSKNDIDHMVTIISESVGSK